MTKRFSPKYYQPYYCEENIWKLIQEAPFSGTEGDVLLISNPARLCALSHQRAATTPDTPVFWDYHVVYTAPTSSKHPEEPEGLGLWLLWDLDTTLGCPLSLSVYLQETFALTPFLPPDYAPFFLPIPRSLYAQCFFSDRQHMRDDEGDYKHPAPPWPAPAPQRPDALPLLELLDLASPPFGAWIDLPALRARYLP
jgi:hypothetical protein